MGALNTFGNNNTPQVLFFPKVDPRQVLVDVFSKKIKALCGEGAEVSTMVFLLFQREVMLRRTPDPTLVRWANTLKFVGEEANHETLYITYLLRKWLACLPPLFSQLSCLSEIQLWGTDTTSVDTHCLEPVEDEQKVARSLRLCTADILHPEKLLDTLMEDFIGTIPFFCPDGESLRESTWMHEGAVFSFQDWWIWYVQCFEKEGAMDCGAMPKAGIRTMAQYLKEQIYQNLQTNEEPGNSRAKHLIRMLAGAEIHSFTG